jgi:hypothetical protein
VKVDTLTLLFLITMTTITNSLKDALSRLYVTSNVTSPKQILKIFDFFERRNVYEFVSVIVLRKNIKLLLVANMLFPLLLNM